MTPIAVALTFKDSYPLKLNRLLRPRHWKTLVLSEVDTEEKLLVARAVSNWHRRQVSKEEKTGWINGLAEIYQKQGLKVASVRDLGGFENQIRQKIAEVTGLHPMTVNSYLSEEFKQTPQGGGVATVSASERVENAVGAEVAESFRKQVLEYEKLSPEERACWHVRGKKKKKRDCELRIIRLQDF